MKKTNFISLIVIFALSALFPLHTTFASSINLLSNKTMNVGNVTFTQHGNEFVNRITSTLKATDNDLSSVYFTKPYDNGNYYRTTSILWYRFNNLVDVSGFTIVADNSNVRVKFYDKDDKLIHEKSGISVNGNMNYVDFRNVKTVAFVNMSSVDNGFYELGLYGESYEEIKDLTLSNTDNDIKLTWSLPSNENLLGAKVYRNGVFLNYFDKNTKNYTDSDLSYNTPYAYTVTAVYDGFETSGITKQLTLQEPKPDPEPEPEPEPEQPKTIIPLPTIDQTSNLPIPNNQGSTMEFFTADRMKEFWENNQKLLTLIAPWIMIVFSIILVGIVLTMVIKFFVQANKKKKKIRHY